jgi:hypothetical protein
MPPDGETIISVMRSYLGACLFRLRHLEVILVEIDAQRVGGMPLRCAASDVHLVALAKIINETVHVGSVARDEGRHGQRITDF